MPKSNTISFARSVFSRAFSLLVVIATLLSGRCLASVLWVIPMRVKRISPTSEIILKLPTPMTTVPLPVIQI